jgi:hypothetical protein
MTFVLTNLGGNLIQEGDKARLISLCARYADERGNGRPIPREDFELCRAHDFQVSLS